MREENMTKTIILGDLLSAGRIVIFNGRRTKAEVLNALIDRIAKEQKLTHLKVLAAISSLFFDGRLKAAFLAANDPQTCLEILARAEK